MVYREKEREEFEQKYFSQRRRESGGQYNPNLVYEYRTFSQLSPFCFDLKAIKNNEAKLIFTAHGCAGTFDSKIEEMGRLINKEPGIQFNLLLGDNFYPGGIQRSRYDNNVDFGLIIEDYKTSVYNNIYKELTSFCILGNHDYNYWSMGSNFFVGDREKGPEVALRQLNTSEPALGGGLPNSAWQMPYRYYMLFHNETKTGFFMLDSNTFLWDKLQQEWLLAVYDEFTLLENKILVMHHPFQSMGKRFKKEHIDLYTPSDQADKAAFNEHRDKETPIGTQIWEWMKEKTPSMKFNVLFCAHDHFMDVRKLDDSTIQCTSGSAGAIRSLFKKKGETEPSEKAFNFSSAIKIKDYYMNENNQLLNKNGYIRCVIDEKNFNIEFIEAKKSRNVLVSMNVKEEEKTLIKTLSSKYDITITDENGKLTNLRTIVDAIKDIYLNIHLSEEYLIEMRKLLSRTYLAVVPSSYSHYQTNIGGKVRPCRQCWWAIDVIISAVYLKITSERPKNQKPKSLNEFRQEISNKHPFIVMSRDRRDPRSTYNKTFIKFSEAYYKNNIEEGDEILISKIRNTLTKVQLPEDCFPDNFYDFFRDFHSSARPN